MQAKKIIIAHRANTNGPNPCEENSPIRVDICLEQGFDVELDLQYNSKDKTLWLGHDEPQYQISWQWLSERSEHIWLHCKTLEALNVLSSLTREKRDSFKYFWQQEDFYTLTSNQIIWAYPGKPFTKQTIIAMPEWNNPDWEKLKNSDCYGICTDFPLRLI